MQLKGGILVTRILVENATNFILGGNFMLFGKNEHIISRYRHRFFETRFKEKNLHYFEGPFLTKLAEKKTIRMNDMKKGFPYHKSQLTRIIKQLDAHGYVIKTQDPEDLRGFIIQITELGEQRAKQVMEVVEEWDRILSSLLSDEDLRKFEEIQQRLIENLAIYFKEGEQDEENI